MLSLGLKMKPPSATLGNHTSVQCYGMVDLDTVECFASCGSAPHAWRVLLYLLPAWRRCRRRARRCKGRWSFMVSTHLFSILSVLALWLFREKLLQLTQGERRKNVDSLVG